MAARPVSKRPDGAKWTAPTLYGRSVSRRRRRKVAHASRVRNRRR